MNRTFPVSILFRYKVTPSTILLLFVFPLLHGLAFLSRHVLYGRQRSFRGLDLAPTLT